MTTEVASIRTTLADDQRSFLDEMDSHITGLFRTIEATEMWQTLFSPEADAGLLRAMMREVSLEIYSYQPQVTAAVFATVGRMPKTDPKMIRTMLLHQADEADHGEMALKDYIALGGDEEFGRNWRMSAPSFAFASLWWGIERMADPFAYLGMMYAFESITPYACKKVVNLLSSRGFDMRALGFATFHATEDVKHTHLLRHLIGEVITKHDGSADAIRFGLDLFTRHYPIPVWEAAYRRVRAINADQQ